MEIFSCPACAAPVYFRNAVCACGAVLVFDPDARRFLRLEEAAPCAHRDRIGCNWRAASGQALCRACAMTRTTPDLGVAENLTLWASAELSKRYALANLMRWGLFTEADPNPPPIFDLLSEMTMSGEAVVMMGHLDGVIVINVLEADDAERESRRLGLGEVYRTMLGHFRHELGHFVFGRLERREGFIDAFRALFGDERADYAEALRRHYAEGPPPDYAQNSVTAYAAAHPHEDWAESFAHLLHVVDMTDSATAAGLTTPALTEQGDGFDPYAARDIEPLLTIGVDLAMGFNHVNRAMGLNDLYPFAPGPQARRKLGFALHWLPEAAR